MISRYALQQCIKKIFNIPNWNFECENKEISSGEQNIKIPLFCELAIINTNSKMIQKCGYKIQN